MSDDWGAEEDAGRAELAGKFYAGRIQKLFRGSRVGVVRSDSGREIPFEFLHVSMIGPLRSFDDLREGMAVGFDVGWTSAGLRVTVLRAGDDPGASVAAAPDAPGSDDDA